MVKDPVCGMVIEPASAAGKAEHAGETYYFCSPATSALRAVRSPSRRIRRNTSLTSTTTRSITRRLPEKTSAERGIRVLGWLGRRPNHPRMGDFSSPSLLSLQTDRRCG